VHRTVVDAEGADVENMEGASLFALCSTMGVRCVEIRAVSNRVGEEFSSWCVDEALENLALTLKHLFVDK
jgi:nucleoside phosphorylase